MKYKTIAYVALLLLPSFVFCMEGEREARARDEATHRFTLLKNEDNALPLTRIPEVFSDSGAHRQLTREIELRMPQEWTSASEDEDDAIRQPYLICLCHESQVPENHEGISLIQRLIEKKRMQRRAVVIALSTKLGWQHAFGGAHSILVCNHNEPDPRTFARILIGHLHPQGTLPNALGPFPAGSGLHYPEQAAVEQPE